VFHESERLSFHPCTDYRLLFEFACRRFRLHKDDARILTHPIWTELASQVTIARTEAISAVELWGLISADNKFNSTAYPWINQPIHDQWKLYDVTLESLVRLESKEGVSYHITRDDSGFPTSLGLFAASTVTAGVDLKVSIYCSNSSTLLALMMLGLAMSKRDWLSVTYFFDAALLADPLVVKLCAATASHAEGISESLGQALEHSIA
jgi:hypothetical protein